ncbi:hypothetical protein [uncultured Clostridium sp.]|uniref:hypothetical protein n=1 Tax=uncultured Clostridium sp. TaxID=59620 RepID=UPI0026152C1E|nr:hypothetical protein [uncultured Clostridium sp.]
MNREQKLKERTVALIEKYATPKLFIARNLGVSHTTIQLWLKGERTLATEIQDKLEIFLEDRI